MEKVNIDFDLKKRTHLVNLEERIYQNYGRRFD